MHGLLIDFGKINKGIMNTVIKRATYLLKKHGDLGDYISEFYIHPVTSHPIYTIYAFDENDWGHNHEIWR